jgi:hypothetical protein
MRFIAVNHTHYVQLCYFMVAPYTANHQWFLMFFGADSMGLHLVFLQLHGYLYRGSICCVINVMSWQCWLWRLISLYEQSTPCCSQFKGVGPFTCPQHRHWVQHNQFLSLIYMWLTGSLDYCQSDPVPRQWFTPINQIVWNNYSVSVY